MNHSSLAKLVHEKGLKKTIKKDNMEIEQYISTFQKDFTVFMFPFQLH